MKSLLLLTLLVLPLSAAVVSDPALRPPPEDIVLTAPEYEHAEAIDLAIVPDVPEFIIVRRDVDVPAAWVVDVGKEWSPPIARLSPGVDLFLDYRSIFKERNRSYHVVSNGHRITSTALADSHCRMARDAL
jgi:hypothetical protein